MPPRPTGLERRPTTSCIPVVGALWVVSLWGMGCPRAEQEVPTVEEAPSFLSELVEERLEVSSRGVTTRGFREDGEVWRGFLVDRGVEVSEQVLRSGSCYAFVGAASSGVRHLSLVMHDAEGTEVGRSRDRPALLLCPTRTSTYFMVVQATGAGLFAARRFRGPTGLELSADDLMGDLAP